MDYYRPQQPLPSRPRHPPRPDQDLQLGRYAVQRPPVADFSFRAAQQFPVDQHSHRPEPRRPRNPRIDQARRGPSRGASTWNAKASERALMTSRRSRTPEQFPGLIQAGHRFKQVGDVESFDVGPATATKHALPQGSLLQGGSREEVAPSVVENGDVLQAKSWSNPDPYTSLPCPSESKMSKDFVGFIRSARVDPASGAADTSGGGDFISLNDPAHASTHPNDQRAQGDEVTSQGLRKERPKLVPISRSARFDAQRNGKNLIDLTGSDDGHGHSQTSNQLQAHPLPNRPPVSASLHAMEPRSKKRALIDLDDVDQGLVPRPPKKKKAKAVARQAQMDVCREWQGSSEPWQHGIHSSLVSAIQRLNAEIQQFYDYVRPRDFENSVRHDLMARTTKMIRSRYADSQVICFGSFAAGLNLPDADMDVVVLSRAFQNGQRTVTFSKSQLHKLGTAVQFSLASPSSVDVVLGAKVPLVKYVDKITGLRVDISFDNDGGVPAVKTCSMWKQQYPVVPTMVSLVKQFLKMHGYDQVFTGGIGGFSVTCMVVSLLQHMAMHKGPGFNAVENLGETLLLFFDFYGRKFDTRKFGILMNPPEYFHKANQGRIKYKVNRGDSLSIVDPNDPNNDLTGGGTQSPQILRSLAVAGDKIVQRMTEVDSDPNDTGTVLGVVFAGDYRKYDLQRVRSQELYNRSGPHLGRYNHV